MSTKHRSAEEFIIDTALENGASLAGIASLRDLNESPSARLYSEIGPFSGNAEFVEPRAASHTESAHFARDGTSAYESVLVIGLVHPPENPQLDWWDGKGTPGNRRMIDILKRTTRRLEAERGISSRQANYFVEKGGVFLKDAAVFAGLGRVGRNNLLMTPEYGAEVRLRALFLDLPLQPTGPIDFDPCAGCRVDCTVICPVGALDGHYDRNACNIQIQHDLSASSTADFGELEPTKSCRRCELVCPWGNGSRSDQRISVP